MRDVLRDVSFRKDLERERGQEEKRLRAATLELKRGQEVDFGAKMDRGHGWSRRPLILLGGEGRRHKNRARQPRRPGSRPRVDLSSQWMDAVQGWRTPRNVVPDLDSRGALPVANGR